MPRPRNSTISSGVRRFFLWAGALSVLAWMGLRVFSPGSTIPWTPAMVQAASAMDSAMVVIQRHCRDLGASIDPLVDPHETCLVGPEHSQLFTSLGQLEAKRTTLSPDLAGLLVHLLGRAGVKEGDTVSMGASGSFPAMMVATLVAVRALNAEPVAILSLGSSSYGATRSDFHLLDLHELLQDNGFTPGPPAAVSLGGSGDVGAGFDPGFREELLRELEVRGAGVLVEPELTSNVAERMGLYGEEPAAFVNVGGAEANLGTSPEILRVSPGLVAGLELPPLSERGVLFEMASRGVPVIHLLNVRGLALRYGIPWDPPALADPGSTLFEDSQQGKDLGFWLITVGYLFGLALVGLASRDGAVAG